MGRGCKFRGALWQVVVAVRYQYAILVDSVGHLCGSCRNIGQRVICFSHIISNLPDIEIWTENPRFGGSTSPPSGCQSSEPSPQGRGHATCCEGRYRYASLLPCFRTLARPPLGGGAIARLPRWIRTTSDCCPTGHAGALQSRFRSRPCDRCFSALLCVSPDRRAARVSTSRRQPSVLARRLRSCRSAAHRGDRDWCFPWSAASYLPTAIL